MQDLVKFQSTLHLVFQWYEKRPYFCPKGRDAKSYSGVILMYFDQYRVALREQQGQVLEKIPWGEPVVAGNDAPVITLDLY